MIDTLATVILTVILIGFEWQQQSEILIAERRKPTKYWIVIGLVLLMVWVFWSSNWQTDAKIVSVMVLLIAVAFFRQGLAKDKVITFGSISAASRYLRYEEVVVVEEAKDKATVTFYGHQAGHYSIEFDVSALELKTFFSEHLPRKVKLLDEQEYLLQERHRAEQHVTNQDAQLKAIRQRKRLTPKQFIQGHK